MLNSQQILGFALSVARLSAWFALLVAVFVPLERLFALHRQKFFRKGLLQDIGYYFINGLLPSLLLAPVLAVVAIGAHAIIPSSIQAHVAALPLWQRVLIGLVVGEVGFYWGHRWTHAIPWLWRFHSVHHSAEKIYFLISAKAHPFDNVFIRMCGLVPAVALGVASPLAPNGSLIPVLIVLSATMWGFFIHANVRWRLGPLEWILATPYFHHWHHTHVEQRDKNFASMLPVMDWIFGTHYRPQHEWPTAYGVDATVPRGLVGQLVYPFWSRKAADADTERAKPARNAAELA